MDYFAIAASVINEPLEGIAASSAATGASDDERIELAGEITQYDCAVAGHYLLIIRSSTTGSAFHL
jgi:hypothetical protein